MLQRRHGASSGATKRSEYFIWKGMRSRCLNRRSRGYANYGGRGVGVCERWAVFENFLADMGPRPSSKHSLDRIDSNGNYEPGNCRWAALDVQQVNRRGVLCDAGVCILRHLLRRGGDRLALACAFGLSESRISQIWAGRRASSVARLASGALAMPCSPPVIAPKDNHAR
jgi:hypothetical protein